MDKTKDEKQTMNRREEVLRRFKASKKRKKEFLEKMEKEMRAEFKNRTGKDATCFEVW